MAITTSGSITFQQKDTVNGKEVFYNDTMHIPNAGSLEALKTFAVIIAKYTAAAIIAVSFSTEEEISGEISGEIPLSDIATLLLHGEKGKTKTKNLAVFSAKSDMFEVIKNTGLLMKRSIGQELAAAYGELVGETFTFVRGRLQR